MMIHEEQKNVEALCECADFIDSGFQSFIEQVRLPKHKLAEAAFFSGAALALKALDHFERAVPLYGAHAPVVLRNMLIEEINQYMQDNSMELEWEPHVPRNLKQ